MTTVGGTGRPTPTRDAALDALAITTLRTLAIDAVEAANSGHPGTPMGAAPMAYVLWTRHLRHAPSRPHWPDRDRFVLSAGHAAMLLYGLLHLSGYALPLEELQRFRQIGSRTPGHPEYRMTPGVEATTGPLGQGFGNAVGMAMAERRLAKEFNRSGFDLFDHWTYVLASDGDIQEGVSSEVASLAGHLRLARLVVLYDDNHTQLDGPTELAFSEDLLARFAAMEWHVQRVADANDLAALDAAIALAKRDSRPSIIAVRSHIAYGSPNKQDSHKAHGQALGAEEARLTKLAYGADPDRTFLVPEPAATWVRTRCKAGERLADAWEATLSRYAAAYPAEAAELTRRLRRELPVGLPEALPRYAPGTRLSTRKASQDALCAVGSVIPELLGGAADLSQSTLTDLPASPPWSAEETTRNLRFGVREHAMGTIANGLAYHGGLRPYVSTYLVFSDYMRGSVRLAALSGLGVVYVWTHDSIALGEDGPTHQPVEQVTSLRAMPGLLVIRPADANETSAAWEIALARAEGPTALVLSRQDLPVLTDAGAARCGTARGAYILAEASARRPRLILLATGSEVRLAVEARARLEGLDVPTRVVSMPCWELFRQQPTEYLASILPPDVQARVSIEAGSSLGWERWVGDGGAIIAVDQFGVSGRGDAVCRAYGFTVDHLVEVALAVVSGNVRGVVPFVPAPMAPHLGRPPA